MSLAIGSIVWGVRNLPRSLAFWTAALNYKPLREPDSDWAILVPCDGGGQRISLKFVTSAPEQHQRHHLDLYTSDQTAEVDRLLRLGAQRVDWRYEPDADYVVLADPDGNRFCVIHRDPSAS